MCTQQHTYCIVMCRESKERKLIVLETHFDGSDDTDKKYYFRMMHTESICTVSWFSLKCDAEYIDTALIWRSSTCQEALSSWVGRH